MAAVLLSEEYAGYVTGANVPVDGGLRFAYLVLGTLS